MVLSSEKLEQTIQQYERERHRYVKVAQTVADLCEELASDLAVRAGVSWRAKRPDSLRKKLQSPEHKKRYSEVQEVFDGMSDLAGVRVTTYEEASREKIVTEICSRFSGPKNGKPEIDVKDKPGHQKHYRATHCQVQLSAKDITSPEDRILLKDTCEIQVCSMLAHVFNEIEHDLAYKPESGLLSEAEK